MEHMLRDQPPRPANMAHIVAVNQGKRPYTAGEPAAPRLDGAAAARLLDEGALVLDGRPHAAFAAGHVPRAFCCPLASSAFEQNAGWILPPDRPLVLVAEDEPAGRAALRRLAFVGLDGRVRGLLLPADWTGPTASFERLDVRALRRRLEEGRGLRVLDVREPGEWRSGHIVPSLQASFRVLQDLLPGLGLPPEEPVAVVCAGGLRSAIACSLLLRRGFRQVFDVHGGMAAWGKAGLPVGS